MENGHWLKAGDTVELEIERVGRLMNNIVGSGEASVKK